MTAFRPLTEPVDYFVLAGQQSPGKAVIEGADSSREILERKGYGYGGAFSVYRGIKLIHFKAVITLVTPADWDEWHAFTALLERPPTGRRAKALDFYHPITADQGITAVLVETVGQPVQGDTGEWTISIGFAEYRRPERALVTPDGAEERELTPGEREILEAEAAVERATSQRDALAEEVGF